MSCFLACLVHIWWRMVWFLLTGMPTHLPVNTLLPIFGLSWSLPVPTCVFGRRIPGSDRDFRELCPAVFHHTCVMYATLWKTSGSFWAVPDDVLQAHGGFYHLLSPKTPLLSLPCLHALTCWGSMHHITPPWESYIM